MDVKHNMSEHSGGNNNDGPFFSLKDKLFGREEETQRLDDILREIDPTTSRPSLVTIQGQTGSGKSAFVRSYPWHDKGLFLASGQFDSHRNAEPYSALIEAMDCLLSQWLACLEKEDCDAQKRSRGEFRELLEKDAEVLRNVLPNSCFHKLTSCARSGRDAHLEESTKRRGSAFGNSDAVNAAFCRIIGFLCSSPSSSRRPSVLFLDDVQWADQASLDILEALLSIERIQGLPLVVVSFRHEKVPQDNHMITSYLDRMKTSGVRIDSIEIKDLDVHGINSLVACMLKNDPEHTIPLAELIHQKTAGNPFFVLQFLRFLRDEKRLAFSYLHLKWEWGNIDSLQNSLHLSDNVADVVAARMNKLPEETQIILKVASCLGKTVPLDFLSEYFDCHAMVSETWGGRINFTSVVQEETKQQGLESLLDTAVRSGILMTQEDTCTKTTRYIWAHDKLQQLSYASIPKSRRASLHQNLGKLLWKMSETRTGGGEWMVFAAADQLNRFSELTGNKSLGIEVARLNLAAANLTMKRLALFPAMGMLQAAARNLDNTIRWSDDNYDLSLRIFNCLADVGVKIGQYDTAMEAVREVESNARNVEDKFKAHGSMLTCLTSGPNRDYDQGVQKALDILKMYGEKLPSKLILPGQVFIENKRMKAKLPGGRLEGLLGLPTMTDGRALKVTVLLSRFLADYATYSQKYEHLQPLIAVRILNIACKQGICDATAYGILLFARNLKNEGHYKEAAEYGQLAIKLMEKFPLMLGSSHCLVKVAVHAAILPATLPFNNSLDCMLDCHRVGLKTGDTERAVSSLVGYGWSYFCTGLPIGPLLTDFVSYGQEAMTFRAPYTVQLLFKIFQQTVLNLQATTSGADPTVLAGDVMNQQDEMKKVKGVAANATLRDINTFRLMLACTYNKLDVAESLIDKLESNISFGHFLQRDYFRLTYLGLAAFAVSGAQNSKSSRSSLQNNDKRKYHAIGRKILKMFKTEASRGSVNAFPILKMLQAEESPCKDAYEEAIKTCARLGLMHHEAYMSERAAIYFLNNEKDIEWSKVYLERAVRLYSEWGAKGKVDAMVKDYKHLLAAPDALRARQSPSTALKGRSRFEAGDSDILKGVEWSSIVSS